MRELKINVHSQLYSTSLCYLKSFSRLFQTKLCICKVRESAGQRNVPKSWSGRERGCKSLSGSRIREQNKQEGRRAGFPCRSPFQYRLWQDDSFGGLQRDLRGLQLFVEDLLVLAVPLLLLFLLALPVGFVPVQLVLWLGVQLLWQEGLQGEAAGTDSVMLVQPNTCICYNHHQSFIGLWCRTERSLCLFY